MAAPCGAVAQMGERCNRTAEVRGSIPLGSTNRQCHASNFNRVIKGLALALAAERHFPARVGGRASTAHPAGKGSEQAAPSPKQPLKEGSAPPRTALGEGGRRAQ